MFLREHKKHPMHANRKIHMHPTPKDTQTKDFFSFFILFYVAQEEVGGRPGGGVVYLELIVRDSVGVIGISNPSLDEGARIHCLFHFQSQ